MLTCLALTAMLTAAPGDVTVTKVADSPVDPRAMTIQGEFGPSINGQSFQQDALTSLGGWQYLGWYDDAGRVCLSRRRLPDGAWEHVRFDDYRFQSNDAHNVISIGVCAGDGTIHLAWDHHVNPLHYRRSAVGAALKPAETPWTAALFGPVTSELEAARPVRDVTYPRFIRAPGGAFQLCYRTGYSGRGQRVLVDYSPVTHTWSRTRPIDSGAGRYTEGQVVGQSRCSYPNGYTYGPDGRLHVTWVWREDAQGANHDLCYTFSDDRGLTWRNSAGAVIGQPGGPVPSLDSPGLVAVRIPLSLGMMNTHGQAVDSRGRLHCVVWHASAADVAALPEAERKFRWAPDAIRRYQHYFRDVDGVWRHRVVPGDVTGSTTGHRNSRPKIALTPRDDLVMICNHGGALDVIVATAATDYTDWRVAHTEPGPFNNEMLLDPHRWAAEGVLSVLAQDRPTSPRQPTPLRVLDFRVE